MLYPLCSESGNVKVGIQKTDHALHLSKVITDLDTISVIDFSKFDYHIESFAFLLVAAALRLEIIREKCSNSKRTWSME